MIKSFYGGGVGEKTSNKKTQWHQQDRIYDADGIALCISSAFNPWYAIEEKDDKSERNGVD